jgi:Uma2 family endonuclease
MPGTATLPDADTLLDRLHIDRHVVISGVSWGRYQMLLERVGDRPLYHSYDRGELELMTKSRLHEVYKWLAGRFLEVWADENLVPLGVGGEMTLEREDLERGLEGDECYWIANEARVRGKMKLDFSRDPPPDLVIEAEVAATVLDRLSIYAALKVPEIWRVNEAGVRVGHLQADGRYEWDRQSACFPALPLQDFSRFFQQAPTTDHLSIVRAFRAWVRSLLGK